MKGFVSDTASRLNHGNTEDTETATENCKDLVGVPFTLRLFSVSPCFRG